MWNLTRSEWASLGAPPKAERIGIESGPAHGCVLTQSLGDCELPEPRTVEFYVPVIYGADAHRLDERERTASYVVPIAVTCLRHLEPTDSERSQYKGDAGKWYFEGTAVTDEYNIVERGTRVAGCYSTRSKTGWLWRSIR